MITLKLTETETAMILEMAQEGADHVFLHTGRNQWDMTEGQWDAWQATVDEALRQAAKQYKEQAA